MSSGLVMPIVVLKTGVAPGTAGGTVPAWISGDPANLAAATTVDCIFDLGPNWSQLDEVQISLLPTTPSTGFSNVDATFSDSTTRDPSRRPPSVGGSTGWATNFAASALSANGPVGLTMRPMGRFLHVNMTNADGAAALGATSSVTVSLHTR
jgi:hypothetical protein